MMMIKDSEDWAMTAEAAARRMGYASRSELRLRNAMEEFLRRRHSDARMCHEMVMGEGKVGAVLVEGTQSHIIAVEVKGDYDNTVRLLHQVGMYQLCVPEVWMIVAKDGHIEDAELIHWLLPSVGLATASAMKRDYEQESAEPCVITVLHEPAPRQPVPVMTLRMLWAQELANVCARTRVMAFAPSKKPPRAKMIAAVIEKLGPVEIMAETCIELRARQALWRADPAIKNVA